MSETGIVVGVLDAPSIGFVDPTGTVALPAAGITVAWSLYTDHWHTPSASSTRQHTLDATPVVETRVAVPSGDVVHRAYAVTGPPTALIVEIENASPAPVAVGVKARGVAGSALDTLVRAAPPWREVERDADGITLIWPLPHRATVRVLVPFDGRPFDAALDPRTQPAPSDVARGWSAQLGRGARLELDDGALVHAIDSARAALLLLAGAEGRRPSADDVMALEDWGFDTEALATWQRLSIRDRRRASRRTSTADAWTRARAELAHAQAGVPLRPANFLSAVRDVVLATTDRAAATVTLFPGFPAEWLGQSVAVHDAPTRRGPVSAAVRWHGARPALLWTAPAGVTVRAPVLDPHWSSDEAEGEALLAPPPDQLLRLATTAREGEALDEPGSFT